MQATPLAIPVVVIFEPKVFGDERGYFYESFSQKMFEEATGLKRDFVQDNHSKSQKWGVAWVTLSTISYGSS